MKRLLWLACVLLCAGCGPSGKEKVSDILAPSAFAEKMKSGDFVLLDVRTPEEFQSGYLAGAQNIDFNAADFKDKITALDSSKTYLVYCASGKRSGKAKDMMREWGFNNVSALEGGLNTWRAANLPVESAQN